MSRIRKQVDGQVVWLAFPDPNDRETWMDTCIGADIHARGGWLIREGEPKRPDELDLEMRPPVARSIPADEIGWPLIHEASHDAQRLVYEVGPAFSSAPQLRAQGQWIIGSDSLTGRTVAFSLKGADKAKQALERGALWLRFSSDLMLPFEARVVDATA